MAVMARVKWVVHQCCNRVIVEIDSNIVYREFKGDSACKYWKIQPYIPYLLKQKGNFVDFDFEKVGKEANRAADWCAHLAMKGMCFDDRVSEPPSSLVKVLRSDGLPATHC